MVKDVQHLSYEDRLKKLNLYCLARRRKREDLIEIEVFKIFNNLENIHEENLFNRSSTTNLRGHNCKLFKSYSKKLCRRHFFS